MIDNVTYGNESMLDELGHDGPLWSASFTAFAADSGLHSDACRPRATFLLIHTASSF